MKKKYKAVIFDLFDTIVDFNYNNLPLVSVNGTSVNTTSQEVYKVFSSRHNSIDYESFFSVFMKSYAQFNELKHKNHIEYPNRMRFQLMLDNMGLNSNSEPDDFIDEMVLAHMNTLRKGVCLVKGNIVVLDKLMPDYHLGLCSNFDYSPTAMSIIKEFGLIDYFKTIVISVDIGFRKPRKEIFEKCFNEMNISPDEAIFVGDNYHADIEGAKSVGMDAIWIKHKNIPETYDEHLPDYTVESFRHIEHILC